MVALFRVELRSYKGIESKPNIEAGREEMEEYLAANFPVFAAVVDHGLYFFPCGAVDDGLVDIEKDGSVFLRVLNAAFDLVGLGVALEVDDIAAVFLQGENFLPAEHWSRIRTNNLIERLNREIRRRTRVVGTFPDGNSALMLVCARLRHVAGTQWGNKKYMNMKHLEAAIEDASIAG